MQLSRSEPQFLDQQQAILKYGCNDNVFNLSSLVVYDHPVDSNGFAIKFVTEEIERYTVNKQIYNVNANSYLLLNGEKNAKVSIESKKNVKGICINVSNAIIAEAVASLNRPDTPFADPELASFFYTDHFLENQYESEYTELGKTLQTISGAIQKSIFSAEDIQPELFFNLSEKLVIDQTIVFKQLQSIHSVKAVTKRDLCRRLILGKEFIDASFTQQISIEQIAKEASMSEYHFFRLFKKMFDSSPRQYIIQKRLSLAKQLLQEGQFISDIALDCGFADIFSFSKSFKKHFGFSPSSFVK